MTNLFCSSCGNCASNCNSLLKLFGRITIAAIFLLAGISKFLNPEATSLYMAAKGMPIIPFFMYSAGIVEILGGLSLLIGFKTRWGALLLALFLIPATMLFHDFWNVGPAEEALQKILFLKNLAIFGGLLYVIAAGAGGLSIDRFCLKNELPQV